MARLKSEFLYHYQQEHGTSLRARLFGDIAKWNRMAQPLAPLVNRLLSGPSKGVLTHLGVHPSREIPPLASKPFSERHTSHETELLTDQARTGREVVFFHDTFMEHNNPEIGEAAWRVLEDAGYQPILLQDKACCGRPAVSKGMLDQAIQLAKHNLALLYPFAQEGIPIVGCEPSCVVMLTDDYPDLVPGHQAQAVAAMTMTIETFLMHGVESHPLAFPDQTTPVRVLFHGHCQQKASFGTEDTLALLNLIPGCQIEEVASGCCGMAGSFGYEHEHYDLSIQLAEMSLAPAIRSAGEQTLICATGTSCRDQILHTTGRVALHPIQVVALAL
jgi:Fe-S oxidoreductase